MCRSRSENYARRHVPLDNRVSSPLSLTQTKRLKVQTERLYVGEEYGSARAGYH